MIIWWWILLQSLDILANWVRLQNKKIILKGIGEFFWKDSNDKIVLFGDKILRIGHLKICCYGFFLLFFSGKVCSVSEEGVFMISYTINNITFASANKPIKVMRNLEHWKFRRKKQRIQGHVASIGVFDFFVWFFFFSIFDTFFCNLWRSGRIF